MSKNRNKRKANKRKQRKKEILEKRKMDRLYEEAKLDPETLEGQIRMDPLLLCKKPKAEPLATEPLATESKGYLKSYVQWILGY